MRDFDSFKFLGSRTIGEQRRLREISSDAVWNQSRSHHAVACAIGFPTGPASISTTARLIRSQTDFPSWSPRSVISSARGPRRSQRRHRVRGSGRFTGRHMSRSETQRPTQPGFSRTFEVVEFSVPVFAGCSSHCHGRIRRRRKAHCPRTTHRDPVAAT